MKVFFLYLLIIVGDSYAAVKIPIGFTLRPITCEEAFYNNVKFVKNKLNMYFNDIKPFSLCKGSSGVTA